jgi:hypothetical protein
MRLVIGLAIVATATVVALVIFNLVTGRDATDLISDIGGGLADGVEEAMDEAAVVH